MNRQVFQSRESAEAFYDDREAEDFNHVSLIKNLPQIGEFQVSWGNQAPEDFTRSVSRQIKREAETASAGRQADCVERGRRVAAQKIAAERGLAGRAAEVFADGFCGVSAKWTDPRAEGLEPVFRAGRAAATTPDAQRAVRVETVAQNHIVPAAGAWRPGWNVFNPEQD